MGLIGDTFGSAGAGRAWWLSLQTYCPAGAGTQDRTLRTKVSERLSATHCVREPREMSKLEAVL